MRYTLIATLSQLDCYYLARHGEPVRALNTSVTLARDDVTQSNKLFHLSKESRTSGDTIQYAGSRPG